MSTIIDLYTTEYPHLIDILQLFINKVQSDPQNQITLVALFGSTARLTAGQSSDADLLVLMIQPNRESTQNLVQMLRSSEDEISDMSNIWRIRPIIGKADASDLDPDFLDGVGRDGVLIYHRDGSPAPSELTHLRSLSNWTQDVEALMRALHVAADTLSAS
jgi:predicted nucleotidyltransferase